MSLKLINNLSSMAYPQQASVSELKSDEVDIDISKLQSYLKEDGMKELYVTVMLNDGERLLAVIQGERIELL